MEERLHVAVFPTNGSGHINPMLELSRRLIPLGFTVSFLLTEKNFAQMQSEDEHVRFLCIPDSDSWMLSPELQEPVEATLKALKVPVRCIISDCFLGWSQDLANSLGVPRVAFVSFSTTSLLMYYNIPQLISEGHIDPVNKSENRMISCIPGVEPFHQSRLPLAFRESDPTTPVIGNGFQRIKEALCALGNNVAYLEHQSVVSLQRSELTTLNYLPVGPLIPKTPSVTSSNNSICLNWLDMQPPSSVLYIAFGSNVSLPAEKVKIIAEAVKRSSQAFIWAMRKEFVEDAPESFDKSLADMFGEQGLIVEWASQTQILEHSSVGGFLTHCGWNSTMEALSSGVPTLCWPCSAEQNVNAFAMVEEWKMGVHVGEGPDDHVTAEVMTGLIKSVMEDGELRKKARELQKVVRNSHASGGSSHRNLKTLKDVILSKT